MIDGSEFFPRIGELLQEVIDAPDEVGYVHILMWEAHHFLNVGPGNRTVLEAIDELGSKGKEVRILLWLPVPATLSAASTAGVKWVQNTHDANVDFVREVRALNHASVHVHASGLPIGPFRSHHEKMLVFNNGEGVKVALGGLNLNGAYRDSPPHSRENTPWHDSGVVYQGPETERAEEHFQSRWNYRGATEPPRPPAQGPTSISGSFGSQSVRFRAQNTRLNTSEIRDELLARVLGAEDFIYMENFSIHEPDLVAALAHKIEFDGTNVSLVVRNPLVAKYDWLHFVTYYELSFASCTGFSYVDGSGAVKNVTKPPNPSVWDFQRSGDWYEDTSIRWPGGAVSITAIRGFVGDTPLHYVLYHESPGVDRGIWMHSKLAVFDDRVAYIGSANFNPRSLAPTHGIISGGDSEVGFFFSGSSVANLQARVWGEYFPAGAPTAAAWKAAAAAHAAPGGMPAPGEYVIPVPFAAYSTVAPSSSYLIDAWDY